jgi:Flp pilus assembly protein TadG
MEVGMKIRKMRSESGQMLFVFAAVFVVLMLFIMLMVDFGGAALTYLRAQVAADSAAYAASQGVDLAGFYETNEVALDPALAGSLAQSFGAINSQGRLRITMVAFQDDRVWLTGEMEYRTLFARAIGLPVIRVRVASSSAPAYGIEVRGQ